MGRSSLTVCVVALGGWFGLKSASSPSSLRPKGGPLSLKESLSLTGPLSLISFNSFSRRGGLSLNGSFSVYVLPLVSLNSFSRNGALSLNSTLSANGRSLNSTLSRNGPSLDSLNSFSRIGPLSLNGSFSKNGPLSLNGPSTLPGGGAGGGGGGSGSA